MAAHSATQFASMLWIAVPRRTRIGLSPQFSKYLDKLAVDTLKDGRMIGHRQLTELIEPPQRLIYSRLAGRDRRCGFGTGLFFHD
jgi:hypothetical protein